jgi:hypothetical protein
MFVTPLDLWSHAPFMIPVSDEDDSDGNVNQDGTIGQVEALISESEGEDVAKAVDVSPPKKLAKRGSSTKMNP